MDSISGLVDNASTISPFDFSFDAFQSGGDQSQKRGARSAEQSSNFDSVVADALSLSPEALEKAKVLQQGHAVIATENTQTQRPFQDVYVPSMGAGTGVYTSSGRISPNAHEEESLTKAPVAEEMRRVPYTTTPDMAGVAALYASNLNPLENLQTRTYTPSNGAAAYEALRLRAADGARPTSSQGVDAQSMTVNSASTISSQKASAAYATQAKAGNPGTELAPPVYTGRWSVGVDLLV